MESVSLVSSQADSTSVGGEEIDPWGADDDVEQSPSTQSLDLEREWEARRLQFHNLGYRDGITAGNNSSVQEGFDVGFREAVVPGFNWGVVRGATSAYTALPPLLKELLLKVPEAGRRLEALHSTVSSISSADAMGMYYKDSVLQKGGLAEDPVHDTHETSSAQTLREEEITANSTEREDKANACCRGGSCESSMASCSHGSDGLSNAGESRPDGLNPSTSTALAKSLGDKSISNEAHMLISSLDTFSGDAKQLEDSTTSHLVSMALGIPGLNASTSGASESSNRLEQYERNVKAEFELSVVKLSSFPIS